MKTTPVGPLNILLRDEELELSKRFYVPVEVTSTCPGCGSNIVKDLTKEYLSYPHTNRVTKLYFTHEDCGEEGEDTEWSHDVVVRISLEEA